MANLRAVLGDLLGSLVLPDVTALAPLTPQPLPSLPSQMPMLFGPGAVQLHSTNSSLTDLGGGPIQLRSAGSNDWLSGGAVRLGGSGAGDYTGGGAIQVGGRSSLGGDEGGTRVFSSPSRYADPNAFAEATERSTKTQRAIRQRYQQRQEAQQKAGQPQGQPWVAPTVAGATQGIPEEIRAHVFEAAQTYNIEPALIMAIIGQESGGQRMALSPRGAQGYMQLMPQTARNLGVTDPYDPRQNILAGTRYLRENLDRFGGDVSLALAAYNAGPGAVQQHGGIPPYSETQRYVPAVQQRYAQLQQQAADPAVAHAAARQQAMAAQAPRGLNPAQRQAWAQQQLASGAQPTQPQATTAQRPQNIPYPEEYRQFFADEMFPGEVRTTVPAPTEAPTTYAAATGQLQGVKQHQTTLPANIAAAICGPAAAVLFARATGRMPTIEEAFNLARERGYWRGEMQGPQSQVNLINDLAGRPAADLGPVNPARIFGELQQGRPVLIDTRGHYYQIVDANPQTGQFRFGDSVGADRWATLDEIGRWGYGPPRTAIYLR